MYLFTQISVLGVRYPSKTSSEGEIKETITAGKQSQDSREQFKNLNPYLAIET